MMTKDIENVLMRGSIAELRALYVERRLSVTDAVNWYLSRINDISQKGPAINAVREVSLRAIDDAKRADVAIASGEDLQALHGIPVLLKDNILTGDGMKAAAGAAALRDFQPDDDAMLVKRLRSAGAIVLGKTNLTEFADFVSDVMPSGHSGNGGVVKNPHGIEYGRGQGSSVGSAAAVAASLCMFAIGTETQNSIQTPASYSSVVGYKPTVGLISTAGIVPLVPSQDSPGPLTRSVEDAILVASVLVVTDVRDKASLISSREMLDGLSCQGLKDIRVGVMRKQMADREEFLPFLPFFENVLKKLSTAGATVIDPCDLPSAEQLQEVRSSVFRTEFKASLNNFLQENESPCGIDSMESLIAWNEAHPECIPYGQSLLLASNATKGIDDAQYQSDRARDISLSVTEGIDAAMNMFDVDVLIAPMGAAAKLTGKAGAPVIAIPCGMGPDLTPFGVTIIAKVGDDARLLAIGSQIERVVGERKVPVI
jgi:amidase